MKKYILHIIPVIIAALSLASCEDDFRFEDGELGSGFVSISGSVEFEPRAAALAARSDGKAMSDIRSLYLVLYNADEDTNDGSDDNATLFRVIPITDYAFSRPEQSERPSDYVGVPAETTTARATFSVNDIPVGYYHIYVVANVDNFNSNDPYEPYDISTPSKLRNLKLTWEPNDIPKNDQMFGYMTVGNGGSEGFVAPKITLNRQNALNLHAWLKRAASKVTLVIDPSQMHNGISVYIHKVTICGIPDSVRLGATSKAESTDDLISKGETIYFNSLGQMVSDDPGPNKNEYAKWMRLRRGSGKHGAVDAEGNCHGETQPALYFYENAQGNYPGDSIHYKQQHWDELGTLVVSPTQARYKDGIPYGTYIEVEGFYDSGHSPIVSDGYIKYRFMLGQDAEYDFNAFRNNHYKLTLSLKGYANQADWHIEYIEEAPELFAPTEYFVSYLYNRQSMLPVRATGNLVHLEAEIIRNDWHPFDSTQVDRVPPAELEGRGDGTFRWAKNIWANTGKIDGAFDFKTIKAPTDKNTYNNTYGFYYGRHKVRYDAGSKGDTTMYITPPHAGFLSLTVPTAYQNWNTNIPAGLFNTSGQDFYSTNTSIDALRDYYYGQGGKGTETNNLPQNIRQFELTAGKHSTGRNEYYVIKNGDGSTSFEIPMWTRPQSMIYISGFSGNNPYEPYNRKAIVRFRATFQLQNGSTKVRYKDVIIYQCRRIINPKGIWRSADDDSPFQVTLMHRESPRAEKFTAFHSSGSWKAYIDGATMADGPKFFSLQGGVYASGDTIFGDDDTPVQFTIKFNGKNTTGTSECGIVRVLYHGFNAEHTIFIRQGFDQPINVTGTGTLWSSFSVYAANRVFNQSSSTTPAKVELTKNPLALGTLFKRLNYNNGLLTSNNIDRGRGVNPGTTFQFKCRTLKSDYSGYLDSLKTWANVPGVAADPRTTTMQGPNNVNAAWADFETADYIYSVPTIQQFQDLADMCDLGFGVLYSDGASVTATTAEQAFAYLDYENDGHENAQGMRGVFVYNRNNARQIFFPIGYTGVGRRTLQSTESAAERGVLRYGSQKEPLKAEVTSEYNHYYNQYRPISYNNPDNNGAIYWAKQYSGGNVGWDINFNDMNFAPYDYAATDGRKTVGGGGDALPIKLVVKKKK